MMEKQGVKEMKEALEGMMELALCLMDLLKDGAQMDDLMQLWGKVSVDGPFKEKLQKAVDGAGKIPEEMKDMDLQEGMELLMLLVPYVPKMVDVFKKKEAQ